MTSFVAKWFLSLSVLRLSCGLHEFLVTVVDQHHIDDTMSLAKVFWEYAYVLIQPRGRWRLCGICVLCFLSLISQALAMGWNAWTKILYDIHYPVCHWHKNSCNKYLFLLNAYHNTASVTFIDTLFFHH